ncbi:hypothetical protein KM903_04800 [Bacillus glycinifermentans]|uniref:Uncharacterized protein n=1 Tax=Bacillus glycinifermentans TaxID=1664069 RepID=A0A0T6BQ31_9BACI|nr:hypothetical protein [Bacillus glycinifermentans]KRT93745.1 hypothetical protein AB447_217130 [Bacillus glycinifermentans]MBU8785731.1 hypothetical protein [Bacillus glycinifermentans]MEC0488032.1 hypothetical protein [Bacillus glycinifermentans]
MYRLLYPLKWTFAALEWSFDRIVTVAEFLADMFGEAYDFFRIRIEIAEQRKRGVRVIYVKRVRRDRG